ncbi:MAG: penicillin acylase family protein [Aureispira sp.]
MNLFKLLLSITITVLLIWILGNAQLRGDAQHTIIDEDGKEQIVPSTESFIPPLGKLLSPSHGFWQNAEGSFPDLATSLQSDQLSAAVNVYYDDRLVPHIFASNTADALFAQGYVTASLRLWQMELQTHSAAGRLAEILGTTDKMRSILSKRDKETRRLGLPWAARRYLEKAKENPEQMEALQHYSDGVNAYIASLSYDDLPLFYKLQDYWPEEWTPLKSALLLKNMGRMLTNKDHDFELTNVLKEIGLEEFDQLYGEYFEEQSPIILDTVAIATPSVVAQKAPIRLYLGEMGADSTTINLSPKGIGSNNWAVGGEKTASGHPILCNDPHLGLNLPAIWFEIQIKTPEYNSYGASLPGAPGVISGFNEHIAWGVTNVSHDVKDWYAIQWKDEKKTHYWFDSTYREASIMVETIKMRGAESILDTIRMTHIGPVTRETPKRDFALRWTLHDPSQEALTFLKLMQATNYEDYKAAIKHFACPAQNFVFAAKNGDIALWTQGKLPLRKERQGRFVQQGTRSSELWPGFIPQAHIPHEYNPTKNFVASANQHSVNPAVYPYDYYGYFEEYRGRYLNRRLAEMDSITIADMKALQYDSYSVKAEDFMTLLKKHLQKGKLDKEALEVWHLVKDWDYRFTKDQAAPTIFEQWYDSLEVLVYDEFLPENNANGKRYRFPEDYNLLHLLKRDTMNAYIDWKKTPNKKETVADMITLAFQKIAGHLPKDEEGKVLTWKVRRGSSIQHMAKVPAFGVQEVNSDGHHSALNALQPRPGPSWRMVVALGPEIEAYGIYPGGQSENPGSFYYKNMIEKWAEGDYYTLLFMKNEQDLSDRIVLEQAFEK